MARTLYSSLAAAAIAVMGASAEELCSLKTASYSQAKQAYPEAAFALAAVEKAGVATWYSDRESNGDYAATAKELVSSCSPDTRLNLVVYGLPNKDCEAGASAAGSRNTNAEQYEAFIKTLADTVGDRKALYVLEPDAVGLIAKEGGCGDQAGYVPKLMTAINLLSSNPNAEIYLDLGYWTLEYPESTSRVASVVKELQLAGRIKGITLNTANYRSTESMAKLCSNFQTAMGSTDLHCVVDTSRNYDNGNSASTEWCNLKSAGIGRPPTGTTGYSNIDYFLWLKPPGESDGSCDAGTADAMSGPTPGLFFMDGFKALWNQGYFVKDLGLAKIGEDSGTPTPAPTTTSPTVTPSPTTSAPTVTPAPTTEKPTPSPTSTTSSPIFQRPIQIDPLTPENDADSDSVGNDDDWRQVELTAMPIDDETTKPTPAPSTLRPTTAPSQPRPTPAVTTNFRGDETTAPLAVTASSVESDGFGKRLLSGAMIFFVGAVAVLGAVIMINRARANRMRAAMMDKDDSFVMGTVPYTPVPQSMLAASPADHYCAL